MRQIKAVGGRDRAAGYAVAGGQGGTQLQQVIYNQEEANYVTPRGVYEIGLGMCIPTMLTYATEEQNVRPQPNRGSP